MCPRSLFKIHGVYSFRSPQCFMRVFLFIHNYLSSLLHNIISSYDLTEFTKNLGFATMMGTSKTHLLTSTCFWAGHANWSGRESPLQAASSGIINLLRAVYTVNTIPHFRESIISKSIPDINGALLCHVLEHFLPRRVIYSCVTF